jgi:hypothetical protein
VIRQRKDRDGLQVQVYAGRDPLTGRKRWVSRQVPGKGRSAMKQARQVEAELLAQIAADQHRGSKTKAVAELIERWLEWRLAADGAGYRQLLEFPRAHVPGCRCSAVEGAGSHGAGLTRMLVDRGEWVVEADRPSRPARRGGKSDALDAIRAVREALAQQRPAAPRRRGDREALRVLLGHSSGSSDRPDVCPQPTQGPHRRCSRGAAGGAPRSPHQHPGHLLRWAASSASQVAGASYDRSGVALDRPSGPGPGCRGDHPGG